MNKLTIETIDKIVRDIISSDYNRADIYNEVKRLKKAEEDYLFSRIGVYKSKYGKEWANHLYKNEKNKNRKAAYACTSNKEIRNDYGNSKAETIELACNVTTHNSSNFCKKNPSLIRFEGFDNVETAHIIQIIMHLGTMARGSCFASAGMVLEKALMKVLCDMFEVPNENRIENSKDKDNKRKVDYRLISLLLKQYRLEVKLNGSGNSESADSCGSRGINALIAVHISDWQRTELDRQGIEWVDFSSKSTGIDKFKQLLVKWAIPCNIDKTLVA